MSSAGRIRVLLCLMFLVFAMTSDAIGGIIPEVIAEYHLSMKAAGGFHYVLMVSIGVGALLLGFLADRFGRKWTVMLGLALYGMSSVLFALASSYGILLALMALSGLGISIFKVGGLALVGDVSTSARTHTKLMNTAEGFFAVGSIIGPATVAVLLAEGLSWKWLYAAAGGICTLLVVLASVVSYPHARGASRDTANVRHTLSLMRDPYALGFSSLIALYVLVEVAIYVWMPTYVNAYRGPYLWLPRYGLTLFFVLRALGRFLGAWLLDRFSWKAVLACFGLAIFGSFAGSVLIGVETGAWLLPLSGLFMSIIYPTLNSKGISCFEKSQHGAAAGVILFFTASAAALGPLAMAAVSDAYGDPKYGFELAMVFALILSLGLAINWIADLGRRPHRTRAAGALQSEWLE